VSIKKEVFIKIKKQKVIIIGAGTAGITIAKNLQIFFDVLLIEKSKYKKYPILYKIPLLIGLIFRDDKTKYLSKRDISLSDGRNIPFFESNLLGGASVINGCVHMVGSKARWEKILSKFEMTYSDLIDSNKKLYSTNKKNSGNKINLTSAPQNLIDSIFIKSLGLRNIEVGDMNFSDKVSCGPILNTVKNYFRTSVLSIINQNKLNISQGEMVERILYDEGGKVNGVKTNLRSINSDFVILSGGVIGTCSFLLKNQNDLFSSKMSNQNLRPPNFKIKDHANLRINVITKRNFGSLNEVSNSFYKKFLLISKHFFGRSSLMQGTGATSAVHLDLDNDGQVDTRIQIVQFTETGRHGSDGKHFTDKSGFSLSINPISPISEGEISLDGSDCIVNPKYLTSKQDLKLLMSALKFCLSILRSEPFNEHISEIMNEKDIEENPEKYIFDNIFSGHHLIGGASDIVNKDFECKSVKGLYVCDASIFSEYAASNIHSSVVLISDLFSQKFIKKNLTI